MRNGKKQKILNQLSVSKLLDDFLSLEAEHTGKSVYDLDDEEYIRMMLKKDVQRTIEREKRANQLRSVKTLSSQKDTLDENIRQRYFPDMDQSPPMKEVTPDDILVDEIVGTLVVKDVSSLASKMKQAVDFVQEEMGTNTKYER